MKTKITIAWMFTALLIASNSSQAQEQKTQERRPHEIGLRFNGVNFSGWNNFDVVFKKQKESSENRYNRYRLILLNISSGDVTSANQGSAFSIGAAIGSEKRKSINDKFKFIHGPEFQFSYNDRSTPTVISRHLNASIGYVVGSQYDINNNFCLTLEIIPSIYNASSFGKKEILVSTFGFNWNSQAALSFMYKF